MTTTNPELQRLYRPVGLHELLLILKQEGRGFPPRLPEQPIFYPVLNEGYAIKIARDWNTWDERSVYAGFVTRFELSTHYLKQFEPQTVGNSTHRELWVPAEQLEEFNQHIEGIIQVTRAFYGAVYRGLAQMSSADEMLATLHTICRDVPENCTSEIDRNRDAIVVNYAYWLQVQPHKAPAIPLDFLTSLRTEVARRFPEIYAVMRPLLENSRNAD